MKVYDLIVIGSGPAGALAAYRASKSKLSVLVLEKGKDLFRRRKDLISGWFGRGIFELDKIEIEDPILSNPAFVKRAFDFIKRVSPYKVKVIKPQDSLKYCQFPPDFGVCVAKYLFEKISHKADILFETEVEKIDKSKYFIVHTPKGIFKSRKCLIATGKNSLEWVKLNK